MMASRSILTELTDSHPLTNTMDHSQALTRLNASLQDLQERHGQVTIADLEAEVINLACLEALKLRRTNGLRPALADTITDAFAHAAMSLTPQYEPAFAVSARFAVSQNIEWDGMWDFLRGYFRNKHGVSIDEVQTNRIDFVSLRHSRYQFGALVSESAVRRVISIDLIDGTRRIMVSIEPSLSPKGATLVSDTRGALMYKGDDDDYIFSIMHKSGSLKTGMDLAAFYLKLIPTQVLIEYHES